MGRMSTGARDAAEQRREVVAKLLLRKLTQREIVDALADEGIVDPSGEPYSLSTVHGDIRELRKIWRANAAERIEEHQSLILAELEEVKRAAWESGELDKVLRAIQQQTQILIGTNVNLRGDANAPLTVRVVYDDKLHEVE